ncbi:prohead [Pectobacterium bacteriophage PM2]|uniref:Putative prohead core protein n=1 Tax=Pectobacterium bacteriophage PM2 TaxID=1429794 RepID=A0A0A0PZK5_9CAUD|nr:prohead [Pectobacterium bacteriophage PM2]AHY25154.1 putative prohead core protein [Pectobacterium bacteriophage PM2]
MEDLIEAIKSNDLVATRKVFKELMSEQATSLIEERKIEIARSIMIEGEEVEDEDDDNTDDKEDKEDKDEGDDE